MWSWDTVDDADEDVDDEDLGGKFTDAWYSFKSLFVKKRDTLNLK